jgi:lipopolysaccharide/colanic/teichoic acid biosynthesis glycosyltransferase
MTKRALDIVASGAALLVLSPVLAVIAAIIKLDSPGPVLFRQERVGRNFKPFVIFKFRTMVAAADRIGAPITYGADPRISRAGRVLRQFKLDELPQLFNIIKGDMSLVGPRPEVPRYVQFYAREFASVLQVRPGLTDLASLKYRDEAAMLGRAENPEQEYLLRVLPDKLQLANEYIRRASMSFDLTLIAKTLFRIVRTRTDS